MSDHSTSVPSYAPEKQVVGMLAEFDTPEQLLDAAKKCAEKGLTKWDTHTPFPLHGLSEAMGLKRSKLPYAVLMGAFAGGIGGIALQYFANAEWYRYLISGKPYFSIPANIPVMFETTILIAGITAFVSILLFCGLPQPYHWVFLSNRFKRAGDDKFFVSVDAEDPQFDADVTFAFLETLGATKVEKIEE